ncbi:orotidine-5'-phosphate decarboxylase [Plantibacter sp. ME-Dv--P-122b]|uniref:orotidine-5'-phosphate decarboxylase n=1 Tax=Plantibacter sp. ME-Dv--P-122b TaxID=3040300 RepID=UPI00254CE386|nr:orotidine-5'-phosphate decarboxylase [Plantibacter sp. ME-Dv--P-122b]
MTASFGTRLDEVFVRSGRLCVGIDPHRFLLEAWGLPDTAAGAGAFGLAVVEATAGRAGIVKPQVAFYERFGSAGYIALEGVLAAARDAGLLVIGDAKRGEIGTSMEGYAEAWLTPDSPLEVDALTVNPYLGFGSLQPALDLAEQHGKGVFVLTATSNPEGRDVQLAEDRAGFTVAASMLDEIDHWNARHHPGSTGSIGAVIGATLRLEEFGLTAVPPTTTLPILAPGFGHQGAAVADLGSIYGDLAPGVIVSESRSILAAGPSGIADAVERSAAAVRSARG